MIISHFEDLRRTKALKDKRDLSLRRIALETGLALSTVQRLNRGDMERVYLSTLDTICKYFGVQQISELIEFVADEPPQEDAA